MKDLITIKHRNGVSKRNNPTEDTLLKMTYFLFLRVHDMPLDHLLRTGEQFKPQHSQHLEYLHDTYSISYNLTTKLDMLLKIQHVLTGKRLKTKLIKSSDL